jgi:hypothetical protein
MTKKLKARTGPRAANFDAKTGAMPISVRLAKGSDDAKRLDRMALVHGNRSAALKAGLRALCHEPADTQDFRARADAAEQRAEAAEREVARLRAALSAVTLDNQAAEAERDTAQRELARMLAEAQPAEVADG